MVISDEELEFQDRLNSFLFDYLNSFLRYFNYFFEVFCILLNCVHLAILLRKSLRTNPVYIIMMGIAIFEDIFFIQILIDRIHPIDFTNIYGECLRPQLFSIDPIKTAWDLVETLTRRMFVWLMVQLALIRTLSISFPMSDWLTKPLTTIICSVVIFLFWLLFHDWPLFFASFYWLPDNMEASDCKTTLHILRQPINASIFALPKQYGPHYTEFLKETEGIIRIITLTVYTFLILILTIKLKLISRKRQKMNKNAPSDNTTWLIILMTITFLISEGAAAGLALFENYQDSTNGEYIVFGYVTWYDAEGFVRTLRVVNSASHAVICYFMSTQYRDTVHKMMCCTCKARKKKEEKGKKKVREITVSADRNTTRGRRKVTNSF